MATDVASALTMAEWALGIPPVLTKYLKSICRVFRYCRVNLMNWAAIQATNAHQIVMLLKCDDSWIWTSIRQEVARRAAPLKARRKSLDPKTGF